MSRSSQSALLDRHSTAVYNQPNIFEDLSWACKDNCACFRQTVVMLYCAAMVDRRDALSRLAAQIAGSGFGRMLAVLLEAAGPLAPIGAQAVYSLSPILGDSREWTELGRILENPDDLEGLIELLRNGEGVDV